MEMKAKTYYGLKMIVRKFRKYGQVERILRHLLNTLIYYAKYKMRKVKLKH